MYSSILKWDGLREGENVTTSQITLDSSPLVIQSINYNLFLMTQQTFVVEFTGGSINIQFYITQHLLIIRVNISCKNITNWPLGCYSYYYI